MRRFRRPAVLHITTVRLMGHAGADAEMAYRSPVEIAADLARDPLVRTARLLVEAGVATPAELMARYDELGWDVRRVAEEVLGEPKLGSASEVTAPLAPRRPVRVSRAVADAAADLIDEAVDPDAGSDIDDDLEFAEAYEERPAVADDAGPAGSARAAGFAEPVGFAEAGGFAEPVGFEKAGGFAEAAEPAHHAVHSHRAPSTDDDTPSTASYPFAPLRAEQEEGGRGAPPHALSRGRRLCRHEHHAAVGVGVVGQRHRHHAGDARFLPLGLGADRAAGGGLAAGRSLRALGGVCARAHSTWTCRSRSA